MHRRAEIYDSHLRIVLITPSGVPVSTALGGACKDDQHTGATAFISARLRPRPSAFANGGGYSTNTPPEAASI